MDADDSDFKDRLNILNACGPRTDVTVRAPLPLEEGRGADLSWAIAPCYTDGMAR